MLTSRLGQQAAAICRSWRCHWQLPRRKTLSLQKDRVSDALRMFYGTVAGNQWSRLCLCAPIRAVLQRAGRTRRPGSGIAWKRCFRWFLGLRDLQSADQTGGSWYVIPAPMLAGSNELAIEKRQSHARTHTANTVKAMSAGHLLVLRCLHASKEASQARQTPYERHRAHSVPFAGRAPSLVELNPV